jgi:AcrR family transcriptional regulator
MGIHERKEREKEHRKEEILDAAQSVFFSKGLFETTMDEIAEKAELSKGTLYLYYKSKEDLYLAVMMRGMRQLHSMFEHVIAEGASVPRTLQRMFDAYVEYFHSHRNYFRMLYFYQTPQFHRQVSVEMKESCGVENRRIWELVVGVMKRGMDAGMLRSELNPIEIGITLWSSATALMMRVDSELELWREQMAVDLEKTLRLSNALLLDSILTERGKQELRA